MQKLCSSYSGIAYMDSSDYWSVHLLQPTSDARVWWVQVVASFREQHPEAPKNWSSNRVKESAVHSPVGWTIAADVLATHGRSTIWHLPCELLLGLFLLSLMTCKP